MSKINKTNKIYSTAIIFIFLAAVILFLISFYKNTLSVSSLKDLYNIDSTLVCVIDGNVTDGAVLYDDKEIYIDTDVIKKYINKYILWEPENEKLTITTKNEVLRIYTADELYYSNDLEISLDMPFLSQNEKAYLSLKTLEKVYNLSHTLKNNILNIEFTDNDKSVGKVKGFFRNLNYNADEKSANTALLSSGSELEIISETNGFYYAKTPEGIVGYINKKYVDDIKIVPSAFETEEKQLWQPENGKINMLFDQIFTSGDKRSIEDRNVTHDGLDVLCPTWFSFENTEGDIHNIADEKYVENAHKNGYQVWALITDNFNASVSHGVLGTSSSREYVIKQIAAFCKIYNLDGINIDFEGVKSEDGENLVLFVRELAPILHKQGVILSVDVYKPMAWSMYYRREELAEAVDYIIVMGYDEHYAGSEESGSVASYDWSVSSIESMLDLGIDKNKLILGIPFYTRIWTETLNEDNTKDISSKAYSMTGAYNFMKEKGGTFEWLDDIGQYYSEVTEGNTTYKLWWENADSVGKRAELAVEYDIAGCAAWKNGMESSDIWEVLKEKLGKE